MADIAFTVTDAGRAALVAAGTAGTLPVTISQLGISATAVTPSVSTTSLPDEIKRISGVGGEAVADYMIHLVAQDNTADTYEVRSLALYLADGTLFAIYGQPSVLMSKSSAAIFMLAADIAFVDIAAADVTFGNTDFLNPPATTSQQGVVELATTAEAQAGIDALRALTPAAAKAAILGWLLAQDGAGSGLDADLLDGQQGAYYLPAGSYTASDIKAKLVTVDGSGSGVDADLLDGQDGSYYANIPARLGYNPVQQGTGAGQLSGNVVKIGWSSGSRLKATVDVTDQGNLVTDPYLAAGALTVNGATMRRGGYDVWGPDNDGAGSGLDADLLDGLQSSAFARRDGVNLGPVNLRIDDADFIVSDGTDTPSHYIWRDWDTSTLFLGTATAQPKTRYDLFTDQGNRYWHAGNDGSGSGLDADLLDGYQGSAFARMTQQNTFTSAQVIDVAGSQLIIHYAGANAPSTIFRADGSNFYFLLSDPSTSASGAYNSLRPFNITLSTGLVTMQNGLNVNSSLTFGGDTVWHAGNDGAGSGLDADLLDGVQGSAFARKDQGTRQDFAGNLHVGGAQASGIEGGQIDFAKAPSGAMTGDPSIDVYNNGFRMLGYFSGGVRILDFGFGASGGSVWHTGNDGAGSGLDADLLDGQQGSYYADVPARLGYTPVQQGGGAGQGTNKVYMGWGGSRLKVQVDSTDQGNVVFDTHISDVWRSSNDGSGSGLDADLLDGQHASAFAKLAQLLGAGGQSSGYFDIPVSGLGTLRLVWGRNTVGGNTGTLITMGYSFSAGFVGGVIGIPDSDISHTDNINGWLYDDTRMYLVNGQNNAVSLQWFALGLA